MNILAVVARYSIQLLADINSRKINLVEDLKQQNNEEVEVKC